MSAGMGPWAVSDMWRRVTPSTGWGINDFSFQCLKLGLTWSYFADVKWRKACEEDFAAIRKREAHFPEAATDPWEEQG